MVAGALALLALTGLVPPAPSRGRRGADPLGAGAGRVAHDAHPGGRAGRGRPRRSGTLVGRLTDSATGAGVVGAPVQVETLRADGDWVPVAGTTTDGAGAVAVAQTLGSSATYRLHHGTPGSREESTSAAVTVTVAALTAEVSAPAVRVGRPVTVTGVLAAGGRAGCGWSAGSPARGSCWPGRRPRPTAATGPR